MESAAQPLDERATAARRIRSQPPSPPGNFLVLPASPRAVRPSAAELHQTILAAMVGAASSFRIPTGRRQTCCRAAMNHARRGPFIAWPGWAHLWFAWRQTLLVSAWFAFVFAGPNWVTAHRAARVRIHLDAELQIPLIPSFTLIYMSIYLLFLAAPFVLRTRREIMTLAVTQTI